MKVRLLYIAVLLMTLSSTAFAQPENLSADSVDAKTISRVPPNMPWNAQSSGYCCMLFDVTPDGKTSNIRTPHCSAEMFRKPSIEAVSKWKYSPKTVDGRPVLRADMTNLMSFVLTDYDGTVIQSPDGFPARRWAGFGTIFPKSAGNNHDLFCRNQDIA